LKRSKNGNENDAENVVAALGKMEMTVGDDRRITRGLSRREALTEMRNGN
jgi:CRISPR/Cas system CSM-associated protein Csm2 small subunit